MSGIMVDRGFSAGGGGGGNRVTLFRDLVWGERSDVLGEGGERDSMFGGGIS